MQPLGYYLGVSKQMEVLVLTLIGICCTIFDASLLDLNSNLHKVWEVALDPNQFSGKSQMYLKYVLSGIILVRSFSVHIYLAFYIVMLWPAIFEERPGLLLPWLMVGVIKCLGMGFMSFSAGMFTCFAYGGYKPACMEFVIAQFIDHAPSFYMWFSVLSYYRELKMCTTIITYEKSKADLQTEIIMRRRKVRSMADNIAFKHHCPIDEERQLISVSTIENIVQQLTTDLHRKTTRSLDSLLGVIAAEAEKEELMNLCDDLPTEETGLTIPEKTAKLLKLTQQDITKAQNKKKLGKGIIFTLSMLNIQNNLLDEVHTVERVSDLTKATYRTLSLPADNLRITKSEKGNVTPSDISKYGTTTEFMTNISETEIGSVLNYSSISLATKNEQELSEQPSALISQIIDALEIDSLEKHDEACDLGEQFTLNDEPSKIKEEQSTATEEQSIIEDQQSTITEEQSTNTEKPTTIKEEVSKSNNEQSPIKVEQQILHSKTSVGCQASTISRNILRSPLHLQRFINDRSSSTIKKISRTPLTKPPGVEVPRSNKKATKIEENYKNLGRNELKEIMPAKVELPKNTSSFKSDGYIMAYNEKMKKNVVKEKHLVVLTRGN